MNITGLIPQKVTSSRPQCSKGARIASILAVSALALGLTACGRNEEPTVGQRLDSAVEKTEQAAADARAKTEAAMDKADARMDQSAERAEAMAKDLGESAKQAANTVMDKVDDATITSRVKTKFAEDTTVSAMAIGVETLKGVVQLSGFAANEAEKRRAAEIARSVPDVKDVRNNIIIRTPTN